MVGLIFLISDYSSTFKKGKGERNWELQEQQLSLHSIALFKKSMCLKKARQAVRSTWTLNKLVVNASVIHAAPVSMNMQKAKGEKLKGQLNSCYRQKKKNSNGRMSGNFLNKLTLWLSCILEISSSLSSFVTISFIVPYIWKLLVNIGKKEQNKSPKGKPWKMLHLSVPSRNVHYSMLDKPLKNQTNNSL